MESYKRETDRDVEIAPDFHSHPRPARPLSYLKRALGRPTLFKINAQQANSALLARAERFALWPYCLFATRSSAQRLALSESCWAAQWE